MISMSPINFSKLIEPLDTEAFFTGYFEVKPLVIKRNDPAFFSFLPKLSDIEETLRSEDILNKAGIRMVKNGTVIPFHEYMKIEKFRNVEVKSRLLLSEVAQLFSEHKASFVLENTKELWPSLASLLQSVNKAFQCTSNANIYISPPEACGFDIHYDSHDVFIVQIAGSKHWKIYSNPFYLPLGIQNNLPFDASQLELLYDIELEEGDTIYMPRGFVHEASTSACLSAHITVGVYNTTLAKVLSDYIVELAGREKLLRQSITGLLNKYNSENELLEQVAHLLTANLPPELLTRQSKTHRNTEAKPQPLFANAVTELNTIE